MTTLALLAAEHRAAAQTLAELGLDDQTMADTLEGMSGDLEHKALSVAHVARSLDADASAVEQWAKDAAERAKAIRAQADRLRDYLERSLDLAGIEKVEGPGVRISWRKTTAVQIEDAAQIPADLMRVKPAPAPEPDKTAIRDAIKAGREVPGARIVTSRALQIR
jgi:hypothetical protein